MAKSVKTNIVLGTSSDNQALYTAPSGTTNGSLRGARVVYIHIANPSPAVSLNISIYKGTVGSSLYILPGNTVISPKGTLTLYTNIELEPAELLNMTAGTDLSVTCTAEEFVQGA